MKTHVHTHTTEKNLLVLDDGSMMNLKKNIITSKGLGIYCICQLQQTSKNPFSAMLSSHKQDFAQVIAI